ncbi:Bll1370 protein [Alloalcanivorax xenomutans]|uniref:DUF2855 family protein n=1 Tax=Alloalcanivorax xenomutans TaxID=1094342 RepID=UPI0006D5BE2E|nr:DUF2855 family protein [Alloalcanivorax xenomutans]CUR46455.1 Bll1370 protein [Alloalcanivorax xenomutans]
MNNSDTAHFVMTAVHGGHPSGRRHATLKIAPGSFFVRRDDPRTFRWQWGKQLPPLPKGEIEVAAEKFALTANNITYARLGDSGRYWDFFPQADGWGSVPVWGYGRVIASRHEEIAEGERIYGYFPMSSHLRLAPEKVTARRFLDGAGHRRELPSTYNEYTRVTEPETDRENPHLVLRPLFSLSLFLADWLQQQRAFGAEQILISSASSKTALGLGFMLTGADRPAGEVIGLTAPANRSFVESTGLYDTVLCYSDLDTVRRRPSVYVDISGNQSSRAAVHRHLGDALRHSCRVGFTHWDAASTNLREREPGLPGPPPTLFFAPDHILARRRAWGAERLAETVRDHSARFYRHAARWLEIQSSHGPEAVEQVYLEVLEGRARVDQANVLYW